MLRYRKIKLGAAWTLLLACLAAETAYAACSNPTAAETAIIYNSASHAYQFCNGTNWLSFGGSGACSPPTSGYSPTSPSNSGYFVLSSGTYNGNLGGRSGADTTCLTELTTNTGWMGYSTANANGQLVAAKVHAFLCDSAICTNLMPATTYLFANAGNGAAGGASFTTDSNGLGPNDSANWSGSTYFGGTYTYWTGRATTSNTQWANTTAVTSNFGCETVWSIGTAGGVVGAIGSSANTTSARWASTNAACNLTENLICFVNP